MPISPSPRRDVIEAFAKQLLDVRQSAGQPSYRQMASRSGCISHTTLHEAAAGRRLPTWETAEQFLLTCGADPAAWRHEWQRAQRLQWIGAGREPDEPVRDIGSPPVSPPVSPDGHAPDARRYLLAGAIGAAAVLAAEVALKIGMRA